MGNEFNTRVAEDTANLFNGVIIQGVTNATANTNDGFAHTLGRVPRGIIVISQDKAGSIYDGGVANTGSTINLKGSAVSIAFTAIVI